HDRSVCLCLFCCGSAHYDVPSFPTRRSSDLTAGVWASGRPNRKRGRSTQSVTAAKPSRIFIWEQKAGSMCPAAGRSYATTKSPPDRKSTRLNSSHVKISYAVFCLKKKKIPSLPSCPATCKLRRPCCVERSRSSLASPSRPPWPHNSSTHYEFSTPGRHTARHQRRS